MIYKIFIIVVCFAIHMFNSPVFAKGFFYKVSTDSSVVYLLGSIHIAKKEAYPLDSSIENSFKNCKNIVFEIDLTKLDPFKILEYGVFKDTSTLENSIPQKYFQIIDSMFRFYSVPKLFYNKLQPWMAVLFIVSLETVYGGGGEYVEGIDLYFAKKIDSTKNVLELESFLEQLEVFKNLYELSPEFFLEYFLILEKEKLGDVGDLFQAWLVGDEKAIEQEISPKGFDNEYEKAFNEILNDKRNVKMAEKISGYLATRDCYFVVVGSAHLFGENGLISLLKKKGYKVTKVNKEN